MHASAAAHATTTVAAQPAVACDEAALRDGTDTARSNIIAGTDGTAATGGLEVRDRLWRRDRLDGDEYNIDRRSTFEQAVDPDERISMTRKGRGAGW